MPARHYDSLSAAMRAYVGVIVVVGFATIVQSIVDILIDPKGWNWTLLAILTLVSGSATVRLPSLPATISVSETFVFTSVLLFGPAAGTITVALDAFIISFWAYKKGDPLYKIVFNVCALPLTIWLAAHLFFISAGIKPLVENEGSVAIRSLLAPLVLFTIAYFALNSWIITFAIALEKHLSPVKIWRDNFVWLSLNYFGGASVAALLVSYTKDLDFTYLAVIVPLLVVLYFTFSMSMGRVEDANRHLTQLNSLYISTIETLAMAIDAKDQITHGHIRRVQTYAVALAKAMGVSDETLIRAVEAAALLHDMGKLAVPEYILNKPGPLTAAEFEKMKLHASVGADILSAIDFPYPVVPIVRHHHENWNGTGYPDGLAGSAIPIGARILSVVDCFDALTSDRPYRPRLPDREAIKILLDRRGTMYDPLVVDAFIKLHPSLGVPQTTSPEHPLLALTGAASGSTNTGRSLRLEDINASAGEVVALFGLAQALSGQLNVMDVGRITFGHLRRLVPHAYGVLFVYVEANDELLAAYASGASGSLLQGMRVAVGQRLTGWVAASRQTIRNSDPVLDLGETAKNMSPRPRSCLSTPLSQSGNLVGVLTIYSADANFFTEEHERLLEAVSRQIAPAVSRSVEHGVQADRDKRSNDLVDTHHSNEDVLPDRTCIALIETDEASTIISPEQLEAIALALNTGTKINDAVFRRGGRQFAILCSDFDDNTVSRVIARTLGSSPAIRFAVAMAPSHGKSLQQLLDAADELLRSKKSAVHSQKRSIH
jgi:putative nucleotidyltransferase with HDIG domain